MGWFFGCFGGSRKKGRKHRTPSSPLPKQQKPLGAVPVRLPAAVSSSIPIKGVPGQERSCRHENPFTVQQVSSSVPVQHNQGAFLQSAVAGSGTPERQQKPGPWYQLDDLEEELEDLRKQIEKGSQDAKNIKQEVSFFNSCGTLIKTPSELKSPQKVDRQQGSMQEGGWRSWLAPSVPPDSRSPPVKNLQFEGLKAALCEPTPTKECHNLLFGVQTPVSSTRLTQSTDHQSMRAQVHEEQFNQFKNGDISDHASIPCQDGINYKVPVDIEPSQKNLSMSSPCIDSEKILNKGEHFDNTLGGLIQRPNGILKQGNMSLCGVESSSCKDDIENENNLMKKRRLVVNVSSGQSSHSLKKPVETDVGNVQEYDVLSQKRLKVVSPVEQSRREINNSSLQADPVPMHFFRCDSLFPIIESGTSIEESTSYDNKGFSQGASHQLQSYNSNNSMFQTSSQSPSVRQSPASQTKSVTFASTNDEEYTTDELSYNCAAVEKYSEGSYTNSTCFNDTNEEDDEEDGLATASYSPSIDSEETLSDLSPEHCFSPPISPSHAKNSTIYRSQENSATTHEKRTANSRSISSTQYSSVYGGRKKQHVSRYDSEEDDITEDDYDLFTDAMSHVSTECSEREHRRWHSRTESMDSVSAHFAQLGCVTDSNLIDTPPKISEWIATPATPNVNIPGKAGQHTSRLRSKPTSSVLTPVENVSQWKQLKERDQKLDVIAKAGGDETSQTHPTKLAKRVEDLNADMWDENKNSALIPSNKAEGKQLASHKVPISVNASWSHASDAVPVNVNASLSHWGIASEADSIRVDASLSQWGTGTTETEPVRVDMSLSHWLKSSSKQNEAHKLLGTSTTTSSSGEGGVISPAPKLQTKEYVSPNSAPRTQKRQSSSYVVSERPILAAQGGDCSSRSAKQRSPWDGKGTPNSTAKYMEDQRVKWHSTPFEQRLEKALDKQGILLQKKLFAATPAAL